MCKSLRSMVVLFSLITLLGVPPFAAAQEAKKPSEGKSAEPEIGGKPSEPDVPGSLRTPRDAMKTFLSAADAEDYQEAAQTLDFSALSEPPTGFRKVEIVQQLKGIIDRLAWVDYRAIPNENDAGPYRFPPGADEQPIVLARGEDGAWRFTPETVAGIDPLWAEIKDQEPIVKGDPWYRWETPLGEVWRIAALFFSLLIGWAAGRVLRFALEHSSEQLKQRGREFSSVALASLARAVVPLALVAGLNIGMELLLLNEVVEGISDTVISILFAIAIAFVAYCLVDVADRWLRSLAGKSESKLDDMIAPMVRTCLQVTIFILLLVQIATILSDKPVTSIIAGLGVGGLAIGLAAQDTIKNFFGSLMIFADRPFELGDRIVIDGHDGPVERVGFRSTTIRTLEGHVVVVPNGELANKTIHNIGKRPNIRRILNIGVTYDTSPEKVERAIEIVRNVLQDHEGMDPELPPRVFFNEFNDSSLNIFAIYWYHPPDWWAYCEMSQRVNMEILKQFNAEGIEFAFPSQTIYFGSDGEAAPRAAIAESAE